MLTATWRQPGVWDMVGTPTGPALAARPADMQRREARLDAIDDRSSDEAIMRSLAAGDVRALAPLYDRYATIMYTLALRIVRDRQQAEDVVQDVFGRLSSGRTGYSAERGKVSSWLLGVTHNRAVDEVRRRRVRIQESLNVDVGLGLSLADEDDGPEDQAWTAERRQLVLAALTELPQAQRRVVELAYYDGLTQREIAEQLGEPLGTIKTRMRLALNKLRGSLRVLHTTETTP